MPSLIDGINRAMDRMDDFSCDCEAIVEPHRKRDCGPMYHAMSWHKRDVERVSTVEAANRLYPPFTYAGDGETTCSVCGCEWTAEARETA